MEGFYDKYSMLLGRSWLWQVKVHHYWNTDLLSLSITSRTVAILTHIVYLVQPCHQPLALHMYDWMVGLTNEEENKIFKTHLKLETIAELNMGNIPNLA